MSKHPSIIIVNGLPATGKTTIARRLAADLKIPLFHKDAVKETLFDQLGHKDREQSKKFGQATYAVLYKILEDYLHGGTPCIIEANFNPTFDRAHFQKLIDKFHFKVIEIFCHCRPEIIIDRFTKRLDSGSRHPGHNDREYLPEFSQKILNQPPLEPLRLDGQTISLDTSDLAALDYPHLLHEIKYWADLDHTAPHRTIGAAFGIIFNDRDEVLLCHRTDQDIWNLPGGAIEKHEAPWDAAVREVKEETGLDVEISRYSGTYFRPDVNENHHDQLTFTFLCHTTGGELTLNEEADQIKYFPLKKLPENLAPRHAERIMDAYAKRSETIFKTLL